MQIPFPPEFDPEVEAATRAEAMKLEDEKKEAELRRSKFKDDEGTALKRGGRELFCVVLFWLKNVWIFLDRDAELRNRYASPN